MVLSQVQGHSDLIAQYVQALGASAVQRYAVFLSGLDNRTSPYDRRVALTKAQEHGLDVATVAKVTAQISTEKAFRVGISGPIIHSGLDSLSS